MSTAGPGARGRRAVVATGVRDMIGVHGADAFIGALITTVVLERLAVGHDTASVALAACWGVPLLVRRRFPLLAPLATLLLIATIVLAAPEVARDTGGELVLSLTAVWMLTAHNPPARAAWGVPAAMTVLLIPDNPGEALMVAVLLAGSAAAGAVHRRDRREAATLHGHVADLARGRDAALRAAATDERARIARELHDIVSHSVSVMTVQAGAARMQLAGDPAQALASVTAVEEATTAALADLDRLVGLLGHEQQSIHGLGDVERLVAQMGEAGLEVRLVVEGGPRPLAGGLDLTLYRILQEALTNARKHGGTVATDVHVRYEPEAVHLRVENDLPGEAADRDGAGTGARGHGLIGMRERVTMYGGRLEVQAGDGRFRVDARVPTP